MDTLLRRPALCTALLVIAVLAVYGRTLTHGFVWDDHQIIVNNQVLEGLSTIPRLFLVEDTVEESTGYYRPVTYITFAIERALWGEAPAGYHALNLFLHTAAVLLFRAVAAALFNNRRLAFVAALVLALHPVATETVCFLAGGRNTLLAACFGLLALLGHIRQRPVPATACFLLAIFSKEFALLFPVIMLLYDIRTRQERPALRVYTSYLACIAGYLALRSIAVDKADFISGINLIDLAAAPYLVVRYLLNLFFPFNLKVLYQTDLTRSTVLACSVLLILLIPVLVTSARKITGLLFAYCWLFLFLLPVINIIPLKSMSLMADRYSYFSLMGFALLAGAVTVRLRDRTLLASLALVCAAYLAVSSWRAGFWKNDLVFFSRMVQDAPDRFCGLKNLGMVHYRHGDTAAALRLLAAADNAPDITTRFLIGDAYIYWKENRPDLAENALRRACAMNPAYPEPYLVLMMISRQGGQQAAAEEHRQKFQAMAGNADGIMLQRPYELCRSGETYLERGLYAEAEIYLWQALQFAPDFIPALIDLASSRYSQGDHSGAVRYLSRVIALEPAHAAAHHNLMQMYRTLGRTDDAAAEQRRYAEAGGR